MKKTKKTIFRHLATCLGISLFSFFLAAPVSAAEYVSVNKDGANIRSGPGTNEEVYWEVFKDFPLKVVQRKDKWAKIEDFEGDSGWIFDSLLSDKKTVIIKVKKANIRVGPGENYEVVASALYGVVFAPTKTEGEWLQVSHTDGTTGWIHKSLVWP